VGEVGKTTAKDDETKTVAKKSDKKESKKTVKKAEKKAVESKVKSRKSKAKGDDLTKIEGIGPKIAEVLAGNGVDTFAKLADAKDTDTQEMIKDVRGNHESGTWNEQAALARDEKWEELEKMQDELDGGKKK
jgi:predicted flap endonuclease-1-like 5' DNA nuclease